MNILILNRPFGRKIGSGAITGPADTLSAMLGTDAHSISLALDIGGMARQVHTIDQIGRISPISLPAGSSAANCSVDDRIRWAAIAWDACAAELARETLRDDAMQPIPTYRLWVHAQEAGWHVQDMEEDYRGWAIFLWYERDRLRTRIRQRAGHGTHGLDFRTIRAPRPPETHMVSVDQQLNKIRDRHQIYRLARISDVLAHAQACRELIDLRVDGWRDIDLVEG